VSSFKAAIAENGGAEIAEDFPKLRDLAYPIQKTIGHTKEAFGNAYFGWIKFEIGSENIPLIEKMLKDEDSVIRFILISTVRENTLSSRRAPGRPAVRSEKPPMSEEEIEKTVEALVAE
ncbi:MAG: 30S ribosomal protein S6, partial [Patescibacteria group bacterium]